MERPTIRMRTIEETANYLKTIDPETAITKNCLRSLIKDGEIPSAMVGTKYLVSLEAVENYFVKHALGNDSSYIVNESLVSCKPKRTGRI